MSKSRRHVRGKKRGVQSGAKPPIPHHNDQYRVGDILSVKVEKAAIGGRLLGYAPDGRVVWVNGVVPLGVTTDIQLTRIKKRTLEGNVLEVQQFDVDSPVFCSNVHRCGGCPWQALSLTEQKQTLEHDITRQLNHATGEVIHLAPTWYSQLQQWRCTTRIHWNNGVLGFYGSDGLFSLNECPIFHPTLNHMLSELQMMSAKLVGKGDIRLSCHAKSDSGTIAITMRDGQPSVLSIIKSLSTLFFATNYVHGISLNLQNIRLTKSQADEVLAYGFTPESNHQFSIGNPFNQLLVPHSAHAFMQAHQEGNLALVDDVVKGVSNATALLELYAGSGNLTAAFINAQPLRPVTTVEIDPIAVQSLRAVAKRQGWPIQALTLDTADIILNEAEHIVIDPPRAGAVQVIEQINQSRAISLSYISCHPAALARDLKLLISGGWIVERARIFMLFPHSGHAEVYTYLTRSVHSFPNTFSKW